MMRTKEELAQDFVRAKGVSDFKLKTSYENMFKWGYEVAIERVQEYLFNTAELHKMGKFYISEDYLKQSIKFLEDEK